MLEWEATAQNCTEKNKKQNKTLEENQDEEDATSYELPLLKGLARMLL